MAARTGELRAALTLQQETEIRRRQLFAEISHELRTPTTVIRGEAQVTLRGGPKPIGEYENSLRRIEDALRQLALTIDDLLTMARSDIDLLSLRHVPLDFHDVLNDVLSHGQAMARAGQVRLDHDPCPDALRMKGDAARLRQLLLALLDNAIRYSRPGGSVHLSARRGDVDGPGPRVDIRDDGIGISAEDLPLVFDRTFRGGNAAALRSDGSGLGLSVVQALARGHGGDIKLVRSPEGRTTAQVWLPLRVARVQLPILMLTALSTVDDRIAGLRLGADDYMCKPFDFDELLARIEALGRRSRDMGAAPSPVLKVADLELDRSTMTATRDGRVLTLTGRELALLELLMSTPGRLFSRERILANVWGVTEDPLTNIVDVYIGRLRSKVDAGQAPL